MEAEGDVWTWTALAAEEGKERAAELFRRSGGSLGRALALAQGDGDDPLEAVMGGEVPLGWRLLGQQVGGERAAELYVESGGSLRAALEEVLRESAGEQGEEQTVPAGLVGTVVTSQQGLEHAIADGRQSISIVGEGDFEAESTADSALHTFDRVILRVRGGGRVVAHGESQVHFDGPGAVDALDDAQADVSGIEDTTVFADGRAAVVVRGQAAVGLRGAAVATIHDRVRVLAAGPANTHPCDRAACVG
jgi:hypothetical protein